VEDEGASPRKRKAPAAAQTERAQKAREEQAGSGTAVWKGIVALGERYIRATDLAVYEETSCGCRANGKRCLVVSARNEGKHVCANFPLRQCGTGNCGWRAEGRDCECENKDYPLPRVEVVETNMGDGVVAAEVILKGQVITELNGKAVKEDSDEARAADKTEDAGCVCTYAPKKKMAGVKVVRAQVPTVGWKVNSTCQEVERNCDFVEVVIQGKSGVRVAVLVVARKRIPKGGVLWAHYPVRGECRCGMEGCRGKEGGDASGWEAVEGMMAQDIYRKISEWYKADKSDLWSMKREDVVRSMAMIEGVMYEKLSRGLNSQSVTQATKQGVARYEEMNAVIMSEEERAVNQELVELVENLREEIGQPGAEWPRLLAGLRRAEVMRTSELDTMVNKYSDELNMWVGERKGRLPPVAVAFVKAECLRIAMSGVMVLEDVDADGRQVMEHVRARESDEGVLRGLSDGAAVVLAAFEWSEGGAILPPGGRPEPCSLRVGEGGPERRNMAIMHMWWREDSEGGKKKEAEGATYPGGMNTEENEL
jgi:hypothetical protein